MTRVQLINFDNILSTLPVPSYMTCVDSKACILYIYQDEPLRLCTCVRCGIRVSLHNSGFQDLPRGTFIARPPSPFWGTTYALAFHHEVIFREVLIMICSTLYEAFLSYVTVHYTMVSRAPEGRSHAWTLPYILYSPRGEAAFLMFREEDLHPLFFKRWILMWSSLEYLFALEMLPLFLFETLIPLSFAKLTYLS